MIALLRTCCVLAFMIHVGPVHAGSIFGSKTVVKIEWQSDLKKAALESQRTGKPILIQMTAPWCGYCHKMLKETFTDPAIAKQVNEHFVPLLLDADENEKVVETLAISSFPSTIIISSEFEEIGRINGFHKPEVYSKKLAPFAVPGRAKLTVAAAAAAPQIEIPQPTEPKRLPPAAIDMPRLLPLPEETDAAVPPTIRQPQPVVRAPIAAAVSKAVPTKVTAPPVKVSFSGVCLVSMLEERERVVGSPQFGVTYKGRRLQFFSAEQLAKFRANPETYWPHNDGHCPVALTRDDLETEGDPECAGVYQKRLVFFLTAALRDEFGSSPKHYITASSNKRPSPPR